MRLTRIACTAALLFAFGMALRGPSRPQRVSSRTIATGAIAASLVLTRIGRNYPFIRTK